MKRCPKCGQSYTDPDINFCLNDGELLSRLTDSASRSPFDEQRRVDDSPPTMILEQAPTTNPTGWPVTPTAQPPARWQPAQNQLLYPSLSASPNQVLGIVSLAAGAASLTVGWCCWLGLLLGPAAIITGIIALIQNKKDPEHYGGRGFAIGGIITGALFLLACLIYIIVVVLLNLMNA